MWGLNVGLRKEKENRRFLSGGQHSGCPNSILLSSDAVALHISLKIGVREKPQGCDKTSDTGDFHSHIELRASRRGKRLKRREEARQRKEEGTKRTGKETNVKTGVLKMERWWGTGK